MVRRSAAMIALLVSGLVLGQALAPAAHADEAPKPESAQDHAHEALRKQIGKLERTLAELERAAHKAAKAGDAEAVRRIEATRAALKHVLSELRPSSARASEHANLRARAAELRGEIEALAERREELRRRMGMTERRIGIGGPAPRRRGLVIRTPEKDSTPTEVIAEEPIARDHIIVELEGAPQGERKPTRRRMIVRGNRAQPRRTDFDIDTTMDDQGRTNIRIVVADDEPRSPRAVAELLDALGRHLRQGERANRPAPARHQGRPDRAGRPVRQGPNNVQPPAAAGPEGPRRPGPSMQDLMRRIERLEQEVRRLRAERREAPRTQQTGPRGPGAPGNGDAARLTRIEHMLMRLLEMQTHDGEVDAPNRPRRRAPVPPRAPGAGR